MTSLPVPVSPVSKTVVFVPATASTWARIELKLPRRPTIVSRNADSARSGLRGVRPPPRYRTVFIDPVSGYGLGCTTKFDAVLICAPVSHRLVPGHFQPEWWSRLKLKLSESPAFPSPVPIRLGDNIRSPEAKQLDQGPGNISTSGDPNGIETPYWVSNERFERIGQNRTRAPMHPPWDPIRLARQPERISNRLKKSKRVL